MSAELIGMAYSPWTEKAKWALDHHQVPYRYSEHLVIFGMPELRLKTGRWTGPLTVPTLVDGKCVLGDSWDIARYADEKGQGAKLFDESMLERLRHYNELSERTLDAARVLVSGKVLADREAKAEVLSTFVPQALRSGMTWLTTVGVKYLAREFGFSVAAHERALEALRGCYSELARDLRSAGGDYLVGGKFSYADVVMAATIQGIEPLANGPVRMGEAMRRCWGNPELKTEYQPLIEWRDRIYARHRGESARVRA